MKFTVSWLKDHLETNATLEQLTTALVNLGLEVESVHNPALLLADIKIARVVTREKHPNADRLSVCQVDVGEGAPLVQVVCGAPNVRADMLVAFAPVGAVIPETGQALKKGKIRDVESNGMLCSSVELGISTEDTGTIMDLTVAAEPGASFATVMDLDDPVIEVSITPNRADCFGVRGIARDLAAAGLGQLKPLPYKPVTGEFVCPIDVIIEDPVKCPGFSGVLVRGLSNGSSPEWVQRRLAAVGVTPISAAVDVTNYLNYDLSRPLHVFDAATLGEKLVVRAGKEGESLEALNDKTYALTPDMVVIADAQNQPVALGGIMGGKASGCTSQTTDVFVECALFDPVTIALTGRKLGLLSDARTRFERGVDPESLNYGLWAAVSLLVDWCGTKDTMVSTVVGHAPSLKTAEITLPYALFERLTGLNASSTEITETLTALGCTVVEQSADEVTVMPPSHRHDLVIPVDLVEEIIRLKGYDAIEAVPLPPVNVSVESRQSDPAMTARRCLAAHGFHEVVTWSFMDQKGAAFLGGGSDELTIANPISAELSVMRPSLLGNLGAAVARNASRGYPSVCFFEVGPQFDSPTLQRTMISGVRSGQTHDKHWLSPSRPVDVFDVKADALAVLEQLGVTAVQISAEDAPSYYHPGRSGTMRQGKKILGYFGEMHPSFLTLIDLKTPLMAFEIDLGALTIKQKKKSALSLSPYQPISRDFAFVVTDTITADQIVTSILKVDRSLITHVTIFDVYAGDKLSAGYKSVACRVWMAPQTATLTEYDLTNISNAIITQVTKTTGGVLRQS